MAKRTAVRRRPRRARDIPQPVIYKEIGAEEAEDIINQRYNQLYFADSQGPHPNENDSEVTVIQGDPWLNMAADFADQSVAMNRAVWRGNLRRTALALALQTWCNGHHLRRKPKIYARDTVMMNKQRTWGANNWGS
jgi:hypothetical protein